MKLLKFFNMCLLLIVTSFAYAGPIDFSNYEDCEQQMQKYIGQTWQNGKLNFFIQMAYTSWFRSFADSHTSIAQHCDNDDCITQFGMNEKKYANSGGCQFVNIPEFWALVKPLLEDELTRLSKSEDSRKINNENENGHFAIQCAHKKWQEPITEGECKALTGLDNIISPPTTAPNKNPA